MLTCKELVGRSSDLLDGELKFKQRIGKPSSGILEEHFYAMGEKCSNCGKPGNRASESQRHSQWFFLNISLPKTKQVVCKDPTV